MNPDEPEPNDISPGRSSQDQDYQVSYAASVNRRNIEPVARQSPPAISVSFLLIGINVAVFAAMVLSGVSAFSPNVSELLKWGADFGPRSMGGEPWRLVSAMFLHSGLLHIFVNMYALRNTGPAAESALGKMSFFLLYCLSGIGGSIASICWHPAIVSVGASGAIFGVFGGLLAFLLSRRSHISPEIFKKNLKSMAGVIGLNLFFGMSIPGINNACHLGGLTTGFVAGWLFAPAPNEPRSWGAKQYLGTLGIIGVLAVGAVFAKQRAGIASTQGLASILSSEKIDISPKESIYYSDGATESEAQELGRTLQKTKFFNGKHNVTVELTHSADGIVVSFIVKTAALEKPEIVKVFEEIGKELSVNAFNNKPLMIRLCDSELQILKTIRIDGN